MTAVVLLYRISIGQLAAKAEINASTLRYYESIGLLPAAERKNGQRRYDERLLERINFIKIAQQTGFSIQEIIDLLEGFETGKFIFQRYKASRHSGEYMPRMAVCL